MIPFSATDYSGLASGAATKSGRAASMTASGGVGMPMITRRAEMWVGVGVVGAMGVLGGL